MPTRTPNRRGQGQRLKEDLIEAASRLLASPPVDEPLSLRAVARQVGVAPQSVYLHFSDRTALVRAVIERRFDELQEAIDQAAAAEDGSAQQLRALCLAFCHFGLEHPGHFKLLFESPATGQMGMGYDTSPGFTIFNTLVEAVGRCTDGGAGPRADAFATAMTIWVALHGIVSLRLSKPGFPWLAVDDLVDRALSGLARVRP